MNTVQLSNIAVLKGIIGGPFGSDLTSTDYVDSGIPVIRGSNMLPTGKIGGGFVYISNAKFESSLNRNSAEAEDIIFTQRGTLGQVAQISQNDSRKFVISQSQMRLRVNKKIAVPRFVFYACRTQDFLRAIDDLAIRTGVPHINLSILKEMMIPSPPLESQRAIAEVLSALDEKIAANSRTMLISQQLIMSMYQSLPTEGGAHLQDITVVRKNKSEPEEIEPNETYIGLEHLTRRSIWANKTGIGSDATSTKSIFHTGDTLFGKLRPYFHKVAIAPTSGVCSTDILVLSPTINELSPLVLAAANDDATVERAVQNSNGTRMPRAKWADISTTPVPNPDATETKHFCAKADELIDLCRSLIVESRTLAATRDELLPLLMS
ncbi:restriction endonuclease subunit S, partial [Corynebacterium variabile]